jgi:cytochrome c peroxidase
MPRGMRSPSLRGGIFFVMVRVGASLALGWCLLGCSEAPPPPAGDADDPAPRFTSGERAALLTLSPATLPDAPADPTNRWSDDARAARLGQRLFFDAALSGRLLDGDNDGGPSALGVQGETGKVACSGCHVPESGFSDSRSLRQQVSLGAGWGLRRTPSLLDVGQSRLLMWDGRHDAQYNQVFGPIESQVEMNASRLFVAEQLFARHREEYERIFGAMPPLDDATRFPPLAAEESGCGELNADLECTTPLRGAPGDGAEYDGLLEEDRALVTEVVVNMGKAIGAYERLLTCGQSRFDAWMAGDEEALSRAEQRGAALFVGKGKCASCHSGPYFSDEKFHNVGVKPELVATVFIDANDPGASVGLEKMLADPLNARGAFSDGYDDRHPELGSEMVGAFRTPRLRCVAMRPSFMHTGHMMSVEAVVSFFSRGGEPLGYPGTNELERLDLSEREQADLVAFLHALTGPGPADPLLAAPP